MKVTSTLLIGSFSLRIIFEMTCSLKSSSYKAKLTFYFLKIFLPLRSQVYLIDNDLMLKSSLYSITGSRILTPLDFNQVSHHSEKLKSSPIDLFPDWSKAHWRHPTKSGSVVFYHSYFLKYLCNPDLRVS